MIDLPLMVREAASALDPDACLEPTGFIDSGHPAIHEALARLGIEKASPRERALKVFAFVRDSVRYEFMAKFTREEYTASHVLAAGRGFCVQKSVLACALGRAAGVPTALVLSDMRDNTLPARMASALGTDVMYQHGLNAYHIGGRWLLTDGVFSPDLVMRRAYRPVLFDGTADALLASTTRSGKPHIEYTAFHGIHADLPFDAMMDKFRKGYSSVDIPALLELWDHIQNP
ncbi:MAG: transglutaminase family protein [Deltaproteobacteria bacterium]|nr:transglutaminase family protein [Deltaproteobacteria bacterium]